MIVHPDWSGTGLTFPDLALMKATKPFSMESGKIGAICLPKPGLDVKDFVGFVAGWGLTRNEDCFTDNFGPERHARCRFPFKYKGVKFRASD